MVFRGVMLQYLFSNTPMEDNQLIALCVRRNILTMHVELNVYIFLTITFFLK